MNTRAAAAALLKLGWPPIPLPRDAKYPPPDGLTGWRGRYLERLERRYDWTANLAIRTPPDIIGLDVDAYALGLVSLNELERRLGTLPDTVMSTSRTDGSGIRLFRVPWGTTLQGAPAEGIQIVQAHHRYVVVAPSIHPEHRVYVWIDTLSGEIVDLPPEPGEVVELPWAWIEALSTSASSARVGAMTGERAQEWIDAHTAASTPGLLELIVAKLRPVRAGGRHDALVTHACWAMRAAGDGEIAAQAAIDELARWWVSVVDPERAEGAEFAEALLWAMGQAETAGPPTLDEWFWSSPQLTHVRQAARARRVGPAAVLGAVLARLAAFIPPTTCVPPIVGDAMPLSTFVALVASSGSGKSAPIRVAAALLPDAPVGTIGPLGLGSGEGVAEAYLEKRPGRKRKEKTKHGALFSLDEGRFLVDVAERKGTSIVAVLCSAWSGATLGQANASNETFRLIPEGTYAVGLISLWQPAKAGALLGEGLTGLPQRFVFLPTGDREAPDARPAWPGPLSWQAPVVLAEPRPIKYPPAIEAEIDRHRVGTLREIDAAQADAVDLDAHRWLIQLKLAGLFANLEGHRDPDDDDWKRAAMVGEVSTYERTRIVEVVRAQSAKALRRRLDEATELRRVVAVVDQEMEAEKRAIDAFAAAIVFTVRLIIKHEVKKVHEGQGCVRRCVSRAMAGRHRKLVDLDELFRVLIERRLVAVDSEGRYVLGDVEA